MEGKKVKICHIVDELVFGGLERTVINIALSLKSYEHEIWCLRKKGVLAEEIESQGITLREFHFEGGISLTSLFKLIKALKKSDCDIVHCHDLFPSMWGRLAALFARIPVCIVHVQNIYYEISGREITKFKLLTPFTTEFIAVSEAVKKCLVEFIGIRPDKIAVIYNSAPEIEKVMNADLRSGLRKGLGIDNDDFVVTSAGRLEERKGHIYLIEALAKLAPKIPRLKCLIIGDGPEMLGLKLKAKSLNLENRVIFTGWRKDAQELLLATDVFIMPSSHKEGLPVVLAEAAAAGLALIATDVGGNPEVVADGVNGFIVPAQNPQILAEKIQYLIDNPSQREKFGEQSYKIWQEKFSLSKMSKEISLLCEKLFLAKKHKAGEEK